MTTKEFFKCDADNIINELESYWSVQQDNRGGKYLNIPFPCKEHFFKEYETCINSPYEELIDYEDISKEEEKAMIQEQIDRISEVYNRMLDIRTKFRQKYNYSDDIE